MRKNKKIFLKTITEGMLIPWGLSWFQSCLWKSDDKRRLLLCVRLPFYWRSYDCLYNEETWGSATIRVLFFKKIDIVWVPDYQFGGI